MKTYLTKSDLERIMQVLEGSLPDIYVSEDELEEIERMCVKIYMERNNNAPVTEQ